MSKTLTIKNLQLRNDSVANWESKNPVLAKGEMGIEIDTNKFKFGNGVSTWTELEYASTEEVVVDSSFNAESENPIQNKVVNDAVHYTNSTPTLNATGGIAAGTTFDNMSITDVLTKLLYPYTKPAVKVTISPNGGTKEKGETVNLTSVKVEVTKKSSAIASVALKNGSTVLKTLTDGVANGGTFDMMPEGGIQITTNTTLSGSATDTDNGTTSANASGFTFVDPYYFGVIANGATVDGDLVTSLTKKVESKGTKSHAYTTSGECMVIAYPASYGVLKSALDPNGFENIASYAKHEVSVTTLAGTQVSYYVYVKEASTVTDFTMKYSY